MEKKLTIDELLEIYLHWDDVEVSLIQEVSGQYAIAVGRGVSLKYKRLFYSSPQTYKKEVALDKIRRLLVTVTRLGPATADRRGVPHPASPLDEAKIDFIVERLRKYNSASVRWFERSQPPPVT